MNKNINVFLISIDCLRADFLGCYGSSEDLTPNIDAFAKEGTLFLNAIANGPSTVYAFPAILTSTYALIDPNYPHMSNFRTTISEKLKRENYKTAGINSNTYLSSYFQYNSHFDYFYDIFSEKEKPLKIQEYRIINLLKDIKIISIINSYFNRILDTILKNRWFKNRLKRYPYQRAEILNYKAFSWLNKNNNRVFVWIHYMDCHHPYLPPKNFREISIEKMIQAERIQLKNPPKVSKKKLQEIIGLYKGTIKYLDQELGKFFNELKRRDLYNNSLIVLTADHGEEFKDHGGFNHKAKLYEELIHVPLIVKGPSIAENIKITNLVSHLDIAPTILDYLNIPKEEQYMGNSLIPILMRKNNEDIEKGIISETLTKIGDARYLKNDNFKIISYRSNKWKLIVNKEKCTKELYNLDKDRNEKNNLYEKEMDIAKNLEKHIEKHLISERQIYNEIVEMQKIKNIIKKNSFSNI